MRVSRRLQAHARIHQSAFLPLPLRCHIAPESFQPIALACRQSAEGRRRLISPTSPWLFRSIASICLALVPSSLLFLPWSVNRFRSFYTNEMEPHLANRPDRSLAVHTVNSVSHVGQRGTTFSSSRNLKSIVFPSGRRRDSMLD